MAAEAAVVVARTGRHKQLYDGNFRLVSGCIPYRMKTDDDSNDPNTEHKDRLEVLMVSSPNRDDLVFPKGGWEDDESVREAACREALEEAGVRGILNEKSLGVWEFWSKSRDACSPVGGCRGYMFSMMVTEELDVWPEQGNRSRKWLNIEEALKLCRYEWMREALGEFLREMTNGTDHPTETEIVESSSPPPVSSSSPPSPSPPQPSPSPPSPPSSPSPSPSSSDIVSERQIMSSSNCCIQTSNTQPHGLSPIIGLMAPGIFL